MQNRFHRLISALLCLFLILSLTACAAPQRGAGSMEELTEKFLAALAKKDYEAVVNLLPEEIVEYGKEYLEGDYEDVIAFAKYAAHDYYWLAKMNLPAHPDYKYEITAMGSDLPESAKGGSTLMEEDGVVLYVQDMGGVQMTVDIGEEEPVEGSLFILQLDDGRYYLISVAGDDEIFVY